MKMVKRLVLEKLEGSYIDEFNKFEGYAQELRDSNPALKNGWKGGLRPFIGLDGTFLKGKYKGILLVAMGQDSVKHFYPLAWAVVDRETSRTWKWFVELLRNSLDLADGEGVTFMSDMHKGLLDAVSQVFPKAHHRWCARHIEANWSKAWKGVQMRKLLWWSAWCTYEEEFHDQLKVMGAVSKQAAKDLVWYPAQNWCRAYFDTVCKNHSCENNFTESFNKWILEAKAKPIIKMLENIRIKIMNRLQKLEEEGKNWKGDFSPYAMELYNDFNIIAQCCQVQSNGDQGYEVVEAYLHDKQEPLDQLSWWYSREAYMLVYMHKIQPVRGEKFWKVDPSHAMEPPEIHKLVGRPKLKRKREKDEARKREGVWSVSRKGLKITCGHCSATGHNQRRCSMLQRSKQSAQDVPVSAPQASQEESGSVFMPTPSFIASSSQQSSQPVGPSNSKKIEKKPTGPSKSKRKIVADESEDEQHVAPSSAVVDEDGCEHESEDEQTILRPKAISEARTRLQAKKIQIRPTGTRRIGFKGDDNGVSIPTNLPYSPRKLAWKGKEAMTSNQLIVEKETRIGKLKAKKGKESTTSDQLTVEKEKRIGKLKAKRGGKK
ncbi:hypothetical protein KY289_003949 [Solanum tuberosum]|nr:hypothetical protein KY289_003949 [Solanum tuberosum]